MGSASELKEARKPQMSLGSIRDLATAISSMRQEIEAVFVAMVSTE